MQLNCLHADNHCTAVQLSLLVEAALAYSDIGFDRKLSKLRDLCNAGACATLMGNRISDEWKV